MKGTRDRISSIRGIIKEEGLSIDRVKPGPHYKFYLRNQRGIKAVYVCGSSASDRSAEKNARTILRRIARQES